MPGIRLTTLTAADGTAFRDLDHDQRMEPFEDPRQTRPNAPTTCSDGSR